MIAEAFFDAFWPNLVATALGALAGIWGALWIERKRIKREAAATTERDRQRTRDVAAEIVTSLEYNRAELQRLRDNMANEVYSLTPAVEVATWEMFRDDVAELFSTPALRGRLARFYGELARIARSSDLYRDTRMDALLERNAAPDDPRTGRGRHGLANALRELLGKHVGIALEHLDPLLADVRELAEPAQE